MFGVDGDLMGGSQVAGAVDDDGGHGPQLVADPPHPQLAHPDDAGHLPQGNRVSSALVAQCRNHSGSATPDSRAGAARVSVFNAERRVSVTISSQHSSRAAASTCVESVRARLTLLSSPLSRAAARTSSSTRRPASTPARRSPNSDSTEKSNPGSPGRARGRT